jgi:hypothetical protein
MRPRTAFSTVTLPQKATRRRVRTPKVRRLPDETASSFLRHFFRDFRVMHAIGRIGDPKRNFKKMLTHFSHLT